MQREEIEEKVAASNERMAQRKARQVRARTHSVICVAAAKCIAAEIFESSQSARYLILFRMQAEELEERRLTALYAEEDRQASVLEQKMLREYAGAELSSKAEIKERRIVDAANRKLEQDAFRAEASRLNFKKKRSKQLQKVQAAGAHI